MYYVLCFEGFNSSSSVGCQLRNVCILKNKKLSVYKQNWISFWSFIIYNQPFLWGVEVFSMRNIVRYSSFSVAATCKGIVELESKSKFALQKVYKYFEWIKVLKFLLALPCFIQTSSVLTKLNASLHHTSKLKYQYFRSYRLRKVQCASNGTKTLRIRGMLRTELIEGSPQCPVKQYKQSGASSTSTQECSWQKQLHISGLLTPLYIISWNGCFTCFLTA